MWTCDFKLFGTSEQFDPPSTLYTTLGWLMLLCVVPSGLLISVLFLMFLRCGVFAMLDRPDAFTFNPPVMRFEALYVPFVLAWSALVALFCACRALSLLLRLGVRLSCGLALVPRGCWRLECASSCMNVHVLVNTHLLHCYVYF